VLELELEPETGLGPVTAREPGTVQGTVPPLH
jgi:hypothetical protein